MSLAKEIEELQRKAGSYELLQEEYEKLKLGVKEVIAKLNSLLGSHVSYRPSADKGYARGGKYSPIVDKLYDNLKTIDGYKVNNAIVEQVASSLAIEVKKSAIFLIMATLAKKQGVERYKAGRSVYLFYRKVSEAEPIKIEKVSFMG